MWFAAGLVVGIPFGVWLHGDVDPALWAGALATLWAGPQAWIWIRPRSRLVRTEKLFVSFWLGFWIVSTALLFR